MTEYKIVFRGNEDGGLDVEVEVIGEDDNTVTRIGDYFYGKIQSQLERFAEELNSEVEE